MPDKVISILSFVGEYRFLSNFYTSTIWYNNLHYSTVEHAYQAQKTTDPDEIKHIRMAPTAAAAKLAGRRCNMRPDWEKVKDDIMRELIEAKFTNPELRKKLLATGDALLIEGNTWGDTYWGVCNGRGQNMLGRILMEEREKCRAAT